MYVEDVERCIIGSLGSVTVEFIHPKFSVAYAKHDVLSMLNKY